MEEVFARSCFTLRQNGESLMQEPQETIRLGPLVEIILQLVADIHSSWYG